VRRSARPIGPALQARTRTADRFPRATAAGILGAIVPVLAWLLFRSTGHAYRGGQGRLANLVGAAGVARGGVIGRAEATSRPRKRNAPACAIEFDSLSGAGAKR
jgi:hypothetical protein